MNENIGNKYKELLEADQILKNYKELHATLREPFKGGDSRKAQIKEWERYFRYSKEGHKYIIKEIYESPKDKNDNRKGGNNKVKYIELIEMLILDLLVQDDSGNLFLSKNRILETLRMVNEKYPQGKYSPNKLSKDTSINKNEIRDFYTTSDDMLQRNLESALNSLENKALIMWSRTLTVGIVEASVKLNFNGKISAQKYERQDEYGDTSISFELETPKKHVFHRKATETERRAILGVERDTLNDMGLESKRDVFLAGKQEIFYRTVSNILFSQYNIYMYYKSYEITYNDNHILEEWQKQEMKLADYIREITQRELNQNIVNRLLTNAKNRGEKAGRKYLETEKDKYRTRMSFDYIQNTTDLIDMLISIELKNI